MKILITGGSGLLAGRLASYLAAFHTLTLVSRKNINNIFNDPSISVKTYSSVQDIEKLLLNQDIILYASGPNAVDCEKSDLVKTYIDDTKYIIKCAKEISSVKKFIFFSSIRAVSDNCQGLITEKSHCSPTTHYGKLKVSIENLLINDNFNDNLTRIILRITNGYGYPAHDSVNCWDLVIMNICKQAVINGEIRLNSDGSDFKDFIPIKSIAEITNNIINNEDNSEIFNVSSGISTKIIDFINKIKNILEVKLSKKIKISLNINSNNTVSASNFTVDNSKITDRQYMSMLNHDKEINNLIDFCVNRFK